VGSTLISANSRPVAAASSSMLIHGYSLIQETPRPVISK